MDTFVGYVTDRIGKYRIVEGVAYCGGQWQAKSNDGDSFITNSRQDAIAYAKQALANEAEGQ